MDLLQVGRRKYTQLRQNLLSSEIHFPSYRKVAEHRNSIILRHLIQPYPTVANPIGIHIPYAQYVRHTFLRILSTLPFPTTQDFPLQFQIADGLDGSGSHTVYNQTTTNTETKSFILFCFRPIKITGCSGNILWKNVKPNSPFTQRPFFSMLLKKIKKTLNISCSISSTQILNKCKTRDFILIMIYMSKLRLFDRCLTGRWQPFDQVQEVHAVNYVPPLSINSRIAT